MEDMHFRELERQTEKLVGQTKLNNDLLKTKLLQDRLLLDSINKVNIYFREYLDKPIPEFNKYGGVGNKPYGPVQEVKDGLSKHA